MVTFEDVNKLKLDILLEYGFYKDQPNKYEEKRYKGLCTVILFNSGKLLVQGSDVAVEKTKHILTNNKLAKEIKKEFRRTTGVVIGSDESLKGDTFGGIVVAGVKVDNKMRDKLKLLAVADSKKLSDDQIKLIAKDIKDIVEYEVLSLNPQEYNQFESSTQLLNSLHNEVKQKLGSGLHIVDEYPGCKVGDVRETKADSKYLEVAAASILAREEALEQLNRLSNLLGYTVPKGSTHVKDALEYLKKSKFKPEEFVKMHFGNVKEFF
jgi:ribonuclease HIII